MAIYLESLSSIVHFFSATRKSLILVKTVPNGKSNLGADFLLQWFEIYGYRICSNEHLLLKESPFRMSTPVLMKIF